MTSPVPRIQQALAIAICGLAVIIALASARPYAGGWNDGSRLATVESLVDRHTLAIDDSMFVRVPTAPPGRASPYPANDALLTTNGTLDKLFVDGHFYSDKSPVPALFMSGGYAAWRTLTGVSAREQPGQFVYWMTLGSSGLAYVVAVCCMWEIGQALRLPLRAGLALTASFGLSTVALTYTRHVNNHIVLLAIAAAVTLTLVRAAGAPGRTATRRLLILGTLSGLAYGVDLGAGPIFFICTLVLVALRSRQTRSVGAFLLAALPWLVLHHAINYAIGGTWLPANSVPAYLQWPGSPFTLDHMTGRFHHTPIPTAIYSAALLVGKRGFLFSNLPLLLLVPGAVILLRAPVRERPEVVWGLACCIGTWLAYGLTSNNYSGVCVSIRWFVPLLAPAYLILALLLREHPAYTAEFLILSAWGTVLATLMWQVGPWTKHLVPLYWPIVVAAVVTWIAGHRIQRARRREAHEAQLVSRPAAPLPTPWR